MSDIDARLMAALQADEAPEHDAVFRVDTLVRLERTRFKRRLWLALTVAAAAAVVLAVNGPAIAAWMVTDVRHALIVACVVIVAMVVLLPDMRREASHGVRVLAGVLDRWLYQ